MFRRIEKKMKILKIDFEIKEFYMNIEEILTISDLAISRAGAGTINDLIRYKIPSIIFPLHFSKNNHQLMNAKFLINKKAAILIEEKNFDASHGSKILNDLIINNNKRKIMQNCLNKISLPNANQIILEKITHETK